MEGGEQDFTRVWTRVNSPYQQRPLVGTAMKAAVVIVT